MTIPWQDFFRPDPQSSNRSLKKYLQGEGLELGHRDLVLIRKLSDNGIILSYAVLETWSDNEIDSSLLEELLEGPTESEDLVTYRTEEGILLVGIPGELDMKVPVADTQAMVLSRQSGESSSPLLTVYGQDTSRPGAGGMWDEDELQQESITLLDGESPASWWRLSAISFGRRQTARLEPRWWPRRCPGTEKSSIWRWLKSWKR